ILVMLFLMFALLIVFSAVWIGLVIARGITVPIQALTEGTRTVASGDLDVEVTTDARDELRLLVDSFNQMTRELKHRREEADRSRGELEAMNDELLDRRRYIETLLQNVTTGVVSLDAAGRVGLINAAALRMLGAALG